MMNPGAIFIAVFGVMLVALSFAQYQYTPPKPQLFCRIPWLTIGSLAVVFIAVAAIIAMLFGCTPY